MTIADWAASEARFARHFSKVERSSSDEAMVPFHEYLELSDEERSRQAAVRLHARFARSASIA